MEIKNCSNDCYCEPKKATHSASPPPPALDLELLQRFARLRDNGKFLDLEIKCSDGATRSVHKFVLNSLSVKLGKSIIASKYIMLYIGISISYIAHKAELLDAIIFSKRFTVEFLISLEP